MERFGLKKQLTATDQKSYGAKHVIRVMTYNVHSCVDSNRDINPGIVAAIIEELNADIIALQEVDAQKPLVAEQNQARVFAEKLRMNHIFFPAEENGLRTFGLAVLSRFAFNEFHHDLLPSLFPRLQPRKRGAIRASMLTPAGRIHIVNAHLSLFKLERRKQLKALLGKDWLLAIPEDEPVIFCGDFNAGPISRTYRTVSRLLTDVQKDMGEILLHDREVEIRTPLDARNMGISFIHQELELVPNLTVKENIFLGQEPRKGFLRLIDWQVD